MAIIDVPRLGEELNGFIISYDYTGDGLVELSPSGIAEIIGSRNFGICYRYLYTIPLVLFFQMDLEEDDPIAVRGPSERICGNVLVFGYDGSPRSLTDFEIQCLKNHTTMERYGENYTVILNQITKEESEYSTCDLCIDD